MPKPRTLGELKQTNYQTRGVKDEMRANLVRRLAANQPVFPGIIGFDDTVVPQISNAILSRHNFILLGLRGQAKSRILRSLISLLDEEVPYIAGCEINDDPLRPICRACFERIEECHDATPIEYLPMFDHSRANTALPSFGRATAVVVRFNPCPALYSSCPPSVVPTCR